MIASTWMFGAFTRAELPRLARYIIEDMIEQQAAYLRWLLPRLDARAPEGLPDLASQTAARLASLGAELLRREAGTSQ